MFKVDIIYTNTFIVQMEPTLSPEENQDKLELTGKKKRLSYKEEVDKK